MSALSSVCSISRVGGESLCLPKDPSAEILTQDTQLLPFLSHSGWNLPTATVVQIPSALSGKQENLHKMVTKTRICSCQRRETQNTTGLGLEGQGGRGTVSSSAKWRGEGAAGTTCLSTVLMETPNAEVE